MTEQKIPYDPLLSSPAASCYLGLSKNTLASWRWRELNEGKKQQIPYFKVGRLIKYRLSALEHYLKSREVVDP